MLSVQRSRAAFAVVVAVLLVVLPALPAHASWTAPGRGSTAARAGTLAPPPTPTVKSNAWLLGCLATLSFTVSWPAPPPPGTTYEVRDGNGILRAGPFATETSASIFRPTLLFPPSYYLVARTGTRWTSTGQVGNCA